MFCFSSFRVSIDMYHSIIVKHQQMHACKIVRYSLVPSLLPPQIPFGYFNPATLLCLHQLSRLNYWILLDLPASLSIFKRSLSLLHQIPRLHDPEDPLTAFHWPVTACKETQSRSHPKKPYRKRSCLGRMHQFACPTLLHSHQVHLFTALALHSSSAAGIFAIMEDTREWLTLLALAALAVVETCKDCTANHFATFYSLVLCLVITNTPLNHGSCSLVWITRYQVVPQQKAPASGSALKSQLNRPLPTATPKLYCNVPR